MGLKECTGFVGRRLLINDLPSRRMARNAIFIPPANGPYWGLFEPSGRSVAEAMIFAGNGSGKLHNPLGSTDCPELPSCPTLSDDYDYIYMGHIDPHYGHFLVGAVGRLWALPAYERDRLRIVFSCHLSVQELMARDYFRVIMTALGLTEKNFLQISTPVRFRRIDVASIPFEELSLVHTIYADLMHAIGRQIIPEGGQPLPARAIYMSKERLRNGNVRVDNESAFTAALRERGVGIVYPEEMGFRDQIKLWASNPTVIGFSGASLHTSIFFPERRVITLAHGPDIWANQCLIDMANNNDAQYLYDANGLEHIGAGNGFNMNYRIRNPEQLASELAEYALS
ncbi:glycosyltransferase family 61 protein [Gluconobacter wancherniae]|uniref:glycosyltransferase family 61 protein n=1 Tax=Gluconobacter wancherniae TaxID=1307955 RepID=UPI001B8C61B7|nr:glycosyltransferase family 61 protein [Gluconobacter wancherniae]MBS1063740.1 glycosyltransferase family 61 protein [Gluconobacter wancherniae]MBS1095339.1 glycosyltransferase family 61 protein [Gluconobacter wancherniae]